eukprot:894744-Prymnesium_polylepis.2
MIPRKRRDDGREHATWRASLRARQLACVRAPITRRLLEEAQKVRSVPVLPTPNSCEAPRTR